MTLGVIFGLTVALTISVFVGMGAALALGAACACFGQLLNNKAQVGLRVKGTVLAGRMLNPTAWRWSDAPLAVNECPG